MRRDDHIVELQQRVVSRSRLDFKHIEPGAGNASLHQGLVEGGFIDDRTARSINQVGRGLHQRQQAGIHQPLGLRIERAVDGQKISLFEQLVKADQLHPKRAHQRRVGLRIVGDGAHLQRLRQPKHFSTDIAGPQGAEHTVCQAGANMVRFLQPAPAAGELVFEPDLLRQHQHKGQGRGGHRPAHAIRGDGQQQAGPAAGGHVNRVVAHAKTGNQLEPVRPRRQAVWPEPGGHGTNRVIALGVRKRDLAAILHVFPGDAGLLEQLQDLGAKNRLAI